MVRIIAFHIWDKSQFRRYKNYSIKRTSKYFYVYTVLGLDMIFKHLRHIELWEGEREERGRGRERKGGRWREDYHQILLREKSRIYRRVIIWAHFINHWSKNIYLFLPLWFINTHICLRLCDDGNKDRGIYTRSLRWIIWKGWEELWWKVRKINEKGKD